jgi:hypothetical protein
MRSRPATLLSLSVLLSSAAGRAEEAEVRGLFVGVRAALGHPAGAISNERDATELQFISGGVMPLALEVGYRLGPRASVGVHGQLARASLTGSGENVRVGVFANYHLPPRWAVDPWIGVTAGMESMGFDFIVANRPGRVRYSGLELVGIQAGGDFWVADRFPVGPFLAATLGMFTREEVWVGNGSGRSDIRARGVHGWLFVGVRGVLPFHVREVRPATVHDPVRAAAAPAARDYDAALREQRSLEFARRARRTGLQRQKLQNVVMLTERALAWLETSDVSARSPVYLTEEEGELTPEVLTARLRQLRDWARRELEALARAAESAAPGPLQAPAPDATPASSSGAAPPSSPH